LLEHLERRNRSSVEDEQAAEGRAASASGRRCGRKAPADRPCVLFRHAIRTCIKWRGVRSESVAALCVSQCCLRGRRARYERTRVAVAQQAEIGLPGEAGDARKEHQSQKREQRHVNIAETLEVARHRLCPSK